MIGLDDRSIDLAAEVIGHPAEVLELLIRVQRIIDEDESTPVSEGIHRRENPGECRLLHSPAIGGPEDCDSQAPQISENFCELGNDILGHRSIRGSRRGHNIRIRVARKVQARVDGDAVAANRDTGAVQMTVGLRVAGFDHRVNVNARPIREDRELVHQSDIDIAVGRFSELRQFRSFRAAHIPHAVSSGKVGAFIKVEELLVQGDARRSPGFVQTSDELRVATQVGEDTTSEDPLR